MSFNIRIKTKDAIVLCANSYLPLMKSIVRVQDTSNFAKGKQNQIVLDKDNLDVIEVFDKLLPRVKKLFNIEDWNVGLNIFGSMTFNVVEVTKEKAGVSRWDVDQICREIPARLNQLVQQDGRAMVDKRNLLLLVFGQFFYADTFNDSKKARFSVFGGGADKRTGELQHFDIDLPFSPSHGRIKVISSYAKYFSRIFLRYALNRFPEGASDPEPTLKQFLVDYFKEQLASDVKSFLHKILGIVKQHDMVNSTEPVLKDARDFLKMFFLIFVRAMMKECNNPRITSLTLWDTIEYMWDTHFLNDLDQVIEEIFPLVGINGFSKRLDVLFEEYSSEMISEGDDKDRNTPVNAAAEAAEGQENDALAKRITSLIDDSRPGQKHLINLVHTAMFFCCRVPYAMLMIKGDEKDVPESIPGFACPRGTRIVDQVIGGYNDEVEAVLKEVISDTVSKANEKIKDKPEPVTISFTGDEIKEIINQMKPKYQARISWKVDFTSMSVNMAVDFARFLFEAFKRESSFLIGIPYTDDAFQCVVISKDGGYKVIEGI
ncbi:MAG: hypothetical protein JW839_05895 [Candidatus Lokiarchaeota archaeon]|nr:hypothetical protein [Candidatus Lokiarchaeota archaeon]